MQNHTEIPRRDFLAVSAAGLTLAGGLAQAAEGDAAKLAVDGGGKAVTTSYTTGPRFGAPERERVEQMLGAADGDAAVRLDREHEEDPVFDHGRETPAAPGTP